jgi:hypothetical protein
MGILIKFCKIYRFKNSVVGHPGKVLPMSEIIRVHEPLKKSAAEMPLQS